MVFVRKKRGGGMGILLNGFLRGLAFILVFCGLQSIAQEQTHGSLLDPDKFPGIEPHLDIDPDVFFKAGTISRKNGFERHSKKFHGPLYTGDRQYRNLTAAIELVNRITNAGGKCQAWFDRRGHYGPFFVQIHQYKLPFRWSSHVDVSISSRHWRV